MKVLILSLELELANGILDMLYAKVKESCNILGFLNAFDTGHSIYSTRRCKDLNELTHCLRRILNIDGFQFDKLYLFSSCCKPTCAVYLNRLVRVGLLGADAKSITIVQAKNINESARMPRFNCWSLLGDRQELPSTSTTRESNSLMEDMSMLIDSLAPTSKSSGSQPNIDSLFLADMKSPVEPAETK